MKKRFIALLIVLFSVENSGAVNHSKTDLIYYLRTAVCFKNAEHIYHQKIMRPICINRFGQQNTMNISLNSFCLPGRKDYKVQRIFTNTAQQALR